MLVKTFNLKDQIFDLLDSKPSRTSSKFFSRRAILQLDIIRILFGTFRINQFYQKKKL
jgi:hypothetical protein